MPLDRMTREEKAKVQDEALGVEPRLLARAMRQDRDARARETSRRNVRQAQRRSSEYKRRKDIDKRIQRSLDRF